MIDQDAFIHFVASAMQTLENMKQLEADGELHAFTGANSATTGYYRMTPDNKNCSVTVDYFHGNYEGSATVTFLIDHVEVSKCH
ncbi:hypothetical protein J9B83_15205 [Marinomonas sp. A79]|uniref:Uncharacterized protein n=1 Tax=Marinomonas vulgaris TaxID=2823372 RepID=A0ABS5HF11_9GAMM|nr:hypothetical protein [Marinomonas vulgaris]MBR7890248.1 hypothetical protein [Marinomonas vulgaris]